MTQTSTRFALSVHILTFLATRRKKATTSEQIAESAGANPAFIRRILSDLSRAGLTTSQLGKGGGALLARGPKKISMLDVYQAVEREGIVALRKARARQSSDSVSSSLEPVLRNIAGDAEAAFFAALDGVSLKQVVRQADL